MALPAKPEIYREADIAIYASEYAYMYIYGLDVCCRTMNSNYYVLSTHKYHFLLTETVELLSVNGYAVQKWFYHCEPTIFPLLLCLIYVCRVVHVLLSHMLQYAGVFKYCFDGAFLNHCH